MEMTTRKAPISSQRSTSSRKPDAERLTAVMTKTSATKAPTTRVQTMVHFILHLTSWSATSTKMAAYCQGRPMHIVAAGVATMRRKIVTVKAHYRLPDGSTQVVALGNNYKTRRADGRVRGLWLAHGPDTGRALLVPGALRAAQPQVVPIRRVPGGPELQGQGPRARPSAAQGLRPAAASTAPHRHSSSRRRRFELMNSPRLNGRPRLRSEEHTSELQS